MKKVHLLVGAGIGFVLGSRAGRGPYEQLEAKVRQIAGRPEITGAVDRIKDTAKTQIGAVVEKVGEKAPEMRGTAESGERTDGALDAEVEGTFPSSDPPSTWAGGSEIAPAAGHQTRRPSLHWARWSGSRAGVQKPPPHTVRRLNQSLRRHGVAQIGVLW